MATITGMGKKTDKPDAAPPPPPEGSSGLKVSLRIPARLAVPFCAYVKSRRPLPTDTSALLLALEEFLSREGFPPSPAPE